MTGIPDPRHYGPQDRALAAWRAHEAADVEFPASELPAWASEMELRRHQRTGAAWLFWMVRALLADQGGLGKTVTIAGLLALMEATGELAPLDRARTGTESTAMPSAPGAPALLIVRAASMRQWRSELARFTPGLKVITLDGPAADRAKALLSRGWHVALISPEMFVSKASKAHRQVMEFQWSLLACDDTEVLKNENKTSRMVADLAAGIPRVVVATATPLDKRLMQIYDTGALLGWQSVLGDRKSFMSYYVKTERTWYMPHFKPCKCIRCKGTLVQRGKQWADPDKVVRPCPVPIEGTTVPHMPSRRTPLEPRYADVEVGPEPANLPAFRARIGSLVLRRTDRDVEDVSLPEVQLTRRWLDLLPDQRERYEEIREGVLTMAGQKVSEREARNLWLRAWQVTSSLATLDGPGEARPEPGSTRNPPRPAPMLGRPSEARLESGSIPVPPRPASVKLDRAVYDITGDLADEPVVAYCFFKPTLADLAARLEREGVSTERIWGDENKAAEREAALQRWRDGYARVLLITDAGGMGLNLQHSRRLLMIDTPRSASRIQQVIWRLRRDGSEHGTVYVTQYLSRCPVDEALAERGVAEAALSAAVLDGGELDPMFGGRVTAQEILAEVTG